MNNVVLLRPKTGRHSLLFMGLSIVLLFVEATTTLLDKPRAFLGYVVEPAHRAAALPYIVVDNFDKLFAQKSDLIEENKRLESTLLKLSAEAMQFRAISRENDRLRELLNSRTQRLPEYRAVEIVGVSSEPDRHEIVIDAGTENGIVEGLPVVDGRGVYGQAIEVQNTVSRVMLLTDRRFALPIEIARSGVRGVAAGMGRGTLIMEDVVFGRDIRKGDQVITSGLANVYPRGLVVGEVTADPIAQSDGTAEIEILPGASTDTGKYVLVILDRDPFIQ